jgi:hypothetical protein
MVMLLEFPQGLALPVKGMEPLLVLIFDAAAIFCESIYLALETFLHPLLDLVQ